MPLARRWPHGLRQQERHAGVGIVDRDVDLENPADGLGRDRLRAAAVDGELAAMQQHDPVGEAHRQIEIMQHGDHSRAVLRAPPCRLHQIDLVAHVEAGGRLVQQQQAGAVLLFAAGELHQHAGKMRALLLAAGERRQLPVAEMREPDLAQRRIDQLLRGGAAGVARAHMDDFLDREREGDVDMLRQHRAVMGERRGG